MKKISIITVFIFAFTFTGCTKRSYTSDTVDSNRTREAVSTADEKESVTKKPTEEQTTEYIRVEYNPEDARREFEESELPDSIKNIFLSDGEFVDTQTQKEIKLSEFKLYEVIYSYGDDYNAEAETYDAENECGVAEWCSYVTVDFDNDGKKELFYSFKPEITFHQGIIFHEHTDGKVYAYRHPSLRVHIGENGDVVGSAGADLSAHTLLRYSFDTERLIETEIAYAKFVDINQYIYYAEGREVDFDEFSTYFGLLSEGSLRWTEFRIAPESGENETSGK